MSNSTAMKPLAAMTEDELRAHVTLLEVQRAMWERRVELYERRADGLEELIAEVVRLMNAMLARLRTELNEVAGIAASAMPHLERRVEELEESCEKPM